MWIFKNSLGQVYTQMIDVKVSPGYRECHQGIYYFQGFEYKFENPNEALGMIVVCNREDWVDAWLANIQGTKQFETGIVAVQLTEDPLT